MIQNDMIDIQNTKAILIGVSEYQELTLDNPKALKNNIVKLKSLLQNPKILGLKEEAILVCGDKKESPVQILQKITTFLEQWTNCDRLLFYYVGHGFRDRKTSHFYFSTYGSTKKFFKKSSIAWEGEEGLKFIFEKGLGIQERVYIIDACHAGAMTLGKKEEDFYFDKIIKKGSGLIAAATAYQKSYYEKEEEFTRFTAEFMTILEHGIEKHRKPKLYFGELSQHLKTTLEEKDSRFNVHIDNTQEIRETPLFNNIAFDQISIFLEQAEKHCANIEFEKAIVMYEKAALTCYRKGNSERGDHVTKLEEEAKVKRKIIDTFRQKIQKENQAQLIELEAKLKNTLKNEAEKYKHLEQEKEKIKANLNTKTEALRKAELALLDTEDYDSVLNQKTKLEAEIKSMKNTLALRDRSITDLKSLLKERKTKLEAFGQEIIQLKKQIQNLKNPPKSKTQAKKSNILTQKLKNTSFEMLKVEGGTFKMGDGSEDDNPIHEVSLDTFYMAKHPVTQKLWKAVMGDNPSYFKGDDLPVENVSWEDAQKFINKLNKLTEKKYRLPTEAEWEYAAGGGAKNRTKYAGTNSENDLEKYAWFRENSENKTHEVGTRNPNQLGLCDMSGNVWEWCQDGYDSDFYSKNQAKTNPKNTVKGNELRVLRGGSWRYNSSNCRVADRNYNSPTNRFINSGFRVASSL